MELPGNALEETPQPNVVHPYVLYNLEKNIQNNKIKENTT